MLISNFKDFLSYVIVENLHPELQDVIKSGPSRKSKQTELTNKIKDSGTLFLGQQPYTEGIDYTVDITHKEINMTTPIPEALSSSPFVFKYQY